MFAQERRDRIVDVVRRRGRARVEELERLLAVSPATLRRDLTRLEREGEVLRVHGGVLPANGSASEPDFARREQRSLPAKRAIARAVNARVPDGAILFLDAGTTCVECARLLLRRPSLRLITHSIPVLALAMEGEASVLCPGGELRRISGALTGAAGIGFGEALQADLALVGASGLDRVCGASTTELAETGVKQQLVARSREAWLLADPSKLGQPSAVQFAPWGAFTRWFAGGHIPPADARKIRAFGVTLHQNRP